MLQTDMKNVRYFTVQEIERTGASLSSVAYDTIHRLDHFRYRMGRAVVLLHNGLTTGQHKSVYHPAGRAVDFCFREGDGPVNVVLVDQYLCEAGFAGIGVYHNGAAYSFHADTRAIPARWAAYRKHREPDWTFVRGFVDPALF